METHLSATILYMIMDVVMDFNHDKAIAGLVTKPRQSEWEEYMSEFSGQFS